MPVNGAADLAAQIEQEQAGGLESGPGVRGVTGRVVVLSLLLAALFGYCIPVVDYKFSNTFLGAAHLPVAAIVVLLLFLLIINPLLHSIAGREERALPLLIAGVGCGALSLAFWYFNEPLSAALVPLYGIISWALLGLGIAAVAQTVRLWRAPQRTRWLLAGVGGLFLSFVTHFLTAQKNWASFIVLVSWILVVACVLMVIGFFLRRPLARNEILTVYITCLFSALVPGRGGENFFIPNILAPFYLATPENKWMDFLGKYIKPWMTPALSGNGQYDKNTVESWFTALSTGQSIPWSLWFVPLIAWCSLILAVYCLLGCLGVMLRAQWAEREALAFPLLRLPIEMTEDMENNDSRRGVAAFFQNPLMWVGFGIAVFIETMNGLNFYYPDVPLVPLSLPAGPLLSEPPWNQIGNMELKIYPAVIGITYLLTSEVSFSLWFIYLFTKFQLVIAYLIGFPPNSMPKPFWTRGWAQGFIGYQQIGAYIAYVSLLLWLGRHHFAHIFRRAIGREAPTPAEKEEALSYPAAFWGFTISFVFVVLWTWAAGVSLHLSLLLWLAYLTVAMGLTRIVAEGGLMFVHTGWMTLGPLAYLFGGGPNRMIDLANAAPASMISGSIMFEMRGFLLPSFVQGMKLAHDRKIASRPLMGLIAGVTVVSFFISIWTIIRLGYHAGGLQLQTWWARNTFQANHTQNIAQGIPDPIWASWSWVGVGAALTWGMMLARSRFLWFPLHPIGLLMCVPFAMYTMWVSIMIGWLCKVMIMRFGGTDTYRKVVPAFLGLALGDMVMVAFWVAMDSWQGRTNHSLLPF